MALPIYVISVRSFTDRHKHIEHTARALGFDFQYVWRFDFDQLTEEDRRGVDAGLRPKSVSNVLKHLEAQRMFLKTDSDVALILEDDVILFNNFMTNLELVVDKAKSLDPGWLLFLGGADNKVDRRFIESADMELFESPLTTAEAYLVDRFGCEARAKWLDRNVIDRQADHQLKLIDNILGIKQYCVSSPMATQGSITGKFSTALDSSRAKHSGLFLKIKYEYNRFRRQTLPRILCNLFKGVSR